MHAQSLFIHAPETQWRALWQEQVQGVHLSDQWTTEDWQIPLSMKEVRALHAFVATQPFGERKVVLLPQADQFTREVANALLKLIEEPPAYLTILLCGETDHLLATIRSRVQIQKLSGEQGTQTSAQQVRTWYQKLSPSNPSTQALLYYGPLLHGTIQTDLIIEGYSS